MQMVGGVRKFTDYPLLQFGRSGDSIADKRHDRVNNELPGAKFALLDRERRRYE